MADTSVDVEALYAALDQKRSVKEMSWRDVANELEIGPSTLSRMAQGRRPDVDTFATLLRWLGMSAEQFSRPSGKEAGDPEPLAMISSYLRARKDVNPDDAAAFEDIMAAAYRRLIEKKKE